MNEVTFYLRQRAAGKPAIDPLTVAHDTYVIRMKKLGYGVTKVGKIYTLPTKAGNK